MRNMVGKKLPLLAVAILFGQFLQAQFLMDMLDTTTTAGKGLLGIYKKYDHLRIGGYIQPQFQVAASKGAKTFEGGDFAPNVSNRFMLRRSRVRIDYVHYMNIKGPGVQIAFQFDANERSFTVRDVWGRIFENKYQLFSFTTGMFARPFGYEVNLSSSDRESPERGRMSQTLMKSERDLGAMVSLDARKKDHKLKQLKFDIGFFNGQGINASGDFDNKKDLITRLALKPKHITNKMTLSAGASLLYGGLLQNTKYVYSTEDVGGGKGQIVDSSTGNIGQYSPRQYHGFDAQLKIKNNKEGFTELRGEFIYGIQTGTKNSSETPVELATGANGFYKRNFNGAYFYFLQNLFSEKHQLVLKYDWYDPNTMVKGKEIGTGFSGADIKYNTLNIGYLFYLTDQAKLVLFYSIVKNETTALPGFTEDLKDNIFTCRVQFRF
jgi:phosphate-selective porin